MERERNNMKKGMTPISNDEAENKQSSTPKEPSQRKSVRKSSHKESEHRAEVVEVERSKRLSRRSVKESSKDKSYHKSRIQQSIQDNIDLQKNEGELNYAVAASPVQGEKSIRSHHPSKRSEVVQKEASNIETPEQGEADQTKKSVRKSIKESSKHE